VCVCVCVCPTDTLCDTNNCHHKKILLTATAWGNSVVRSSRTRVAISSVYLRVVEHDISSMQGRARARAHTHTQPGLTSIALLASFCCAHKLREYGSSIPHGQPCAELPVASVREQQVLSDTHEMLPDIHKQSTMRTKGCGCDTQRPFTHRLGNLHSNRIAQDWNQIGQVAWSDSSFGSCQLKPDHFGL
jgi:hypothetical protein